MAILRVRKAVMFLREMGDMLILKVPKNVTLLREKGELSIMKVRENVTLQREKGDISILRVREDDVTLPMKRGHWSILRPCNAVPIFMTITKTPSYCRTAH